MRQDSELARQIYDSRSTDDVIETTLRTDDRVLARVTDGIYRQPGSALRELISNAYDADANTVTILTDAPRFSRISVEDNGHGMTPDALAHLVHHIGSSAKRSTIGADIGVTAEDDPLVSPGGRRLIGKIGIGLFSVAQLTHNFQIITKAAGDDYRTIATVALRQYSEEISTPDAQDVEHFESGKVAIWREPAADVESHGTTIVLTNIRSQTRDTLRSRDIWAAIEQSQSDVSADDLSHIQAPRFHVARLDPLSGALTHRGGAPLNHLPWTADDQPDKAFSELVDSVWKELQTVTPNPKLDLIFDYYLRMVWQLALSVPLPYVKSSPFDLRCEESAYVYRLSNTLKGSAKRIMATGTTAGNVLESRPDHDSDIFDVFIDNLELKRPIVFEGLPTTSHAIKKPMIFVGECHETFENVSREISGGTLSFRAYLFWTPKVAPTEHQGSLIRIHGASGTLFDPTFMRYQVSEQTRLRQITCEILVSEGLDGALNIDRESFNYAHPHSVFITRWLHSALRQLATAQKKLADELRTVERGRAIVTSDAEIQDVVEEVWARETNDSASSPPSIEFSLTGTKAAESSADSYVFTRTEVIPQTAPKRGRKPEVKDAIVESKVKAIAQVLASYGVLDELPRTRQEQLLNAIYRILKVSAD